MDYDFLEEKTISHIDWYLDMWGVPEFWEITEIANDITESF